MSNVDFDALSTKVEMVKLGMRHTKDGHVISFAINPHDTPQSLMTDPLGQRYVAVLVRVNEQDEPVASQVDEEGTKAVKLAGTLCSDSNFQQWLIRVGEISDMTEISASTWMRQYLGVTSRRELKTNAEARRKLDNVRNEFIAALNSGRHLR